VNNINYFLVYKRHYLSILLALILTLCAGATVRGLIGLAAESQNILWRWSWSYIATACLFAGIFAGLGKWLSPASGIVLLFAICCAALGVALPAFAVILLFASAYVVGCVCLPFSRVGVSDALLVGLTVLGTVVGLLMMFPINNPGTYTLLLVTVLVLGRNHLNEVGKIFRSAQQVGREAPLPLYMGASAALMALLVSLMPEVGHDGLGKHLFIAKYVASNGKWHFDVDQQLWAVMPMLVNWLYCLSYLIGGEIAARVTNFLGVCLLGLSAYRIAAWAGKADSSGPWSLMLFFTTPLVFLETSSLFVDGLWAALLVAGAFAVHRMLVQEESRLQNLYLAAILMGGAFSAKLLSICLLPILCLQILFYGRSIIKLGYKHLTAALALFICIGMVPYLNSFIHTSNPVFPFFNGFFESSHYAPNNFADHRWKNGPSIDFFFKVIFESSSYMEGTVGAGGFQWLLAIPAALFLTIAVAPTNRTMLLSTTFIGYSAIVLWQTGYLRYLLPSVAFGSALISVAVESLTGRNLATANFYKACVIAAVILNLLHYQSATWYGTIDIRVPLFEESRESYIRHFAPQRKAAEIVNAMNTASAPVAVIGLPTIADLNAPQLTSSWYTWNFSGQLSDIRDVQALKQLLVSRKVVYMIVNTAESSQGLSALANEIGAPIMQVGPINIRKLEAH